MMVLEKEKEGKQKKEQGGINQAAALERSQEQFVGAGI